MKDWVIVVCGRRAAGGLLAAGLLLALPAASRAQVTPPPQEKPAPARVYPLTPAPRQVPPGVEEFFSIAAWHETGIKPAGITRSLPPDRMLSTASEAPTQTSVTLWTGAFDVEAFETGGTPYAAVAFCSGFMIYNLSGAGDPVAVSSRHIEKGAWRLTVEYPRLYVVDGIEDGVYIYDISNPAAPSQLGYYVPATGTRIINIFVDNSILYLARHTDDLWIVDLTTPSAPSELAVYEPSVVTGAPVWDVAVSGGYAFMTCGNDGLMEVADVSNPSFPTYSTDVLFPFQTMDDVACLPAGSFHATDVIATSGEVTTSGNITIDFYSWVPGTGLTWLDYIELTTSGGAFGFYDLELFENQAFAALDEAGVVAINITGITTGTSPTYSGQSNYNYEIRGVSIDAVNRHLLQAGTWDGLARHTLLDDAFPLSLIDRVDDGGWVHRCQIWDDLLFVANGHKGITVLDIADPTAPYVINSYETSGWASDIEIDPPYLYVAEDTGGVTALHYSVSSNLFTWLDTEPVSSGRAWDLEMNTSGSGAYEYLYVAQGFDGVVTLDISNPHNISTVDTRPFTGAGARGALTVDFNAGFEKLSVALAEDGVDVYDLTSPGAPSYEFTIAPKTDECIGVESDWDGNLWVTDLEHDLTAWDISFGAPPTELGGWNPSPGNFRQITNFESNALLGKGWWGISILNWSDPTGVFEETFFETAGYACQIAPALDFFFIADYYALVGAQMPSDLLLDVSPDGVQMLTVGSDLQFGASGYSGGTYWDTDCHDVDGRTIASVDATGLLTAVAAGWTRVYVYDDAGKWGASDRVLVQGGPTLIDTHHDEWVYNVDDTGTYLLVPHHTFEEPVEIEIVTLDLATQAPAPPTGYELLAAFDVGGMLYWAASPITPSDFAHGVFLAIHYDPNDLPGGMDEQNLIMKKYDSGSFAWVDLVISTPDPDNDHVVGTLTGFSTFAVMYPTVTLEAPVLSGPADEAWLNTATIDFAWQSVTDAAEYCLEVATDPWFDPGDIVDSETVYTNSARLELDPISDDQYFWRVRASDGTFNSDWSATRSFIVDTTVPGIEGVQVSSNISYNSAVTVTANADDNLQLQWVHLEYRATGSGMWSYSGMTNTGGVSYSGQIPGGVVGYNGFQYRVAACDMAGNEIRATAGGTIGEDGAGGVQISFSTLPTPSNIPPDGWYMVSVPHCPDNTIIGDILTGVGEYDDTVWRFFQWQDETYQEVSNASLAPGRAYWLHHRRSDVHFAIGSGETVESGVPFELTVSPGWNDIGSPWLFSVPWDEILAETGITGTQVTGVYTYNGTSWGLPGAGQNVPAWRGVSVYNRTAGNIVLQIPPVNAAGAAGSAAGEAAAVTAVRPRDEVFDGWRLQLTVSQEGSPAVDDQNFVGVRSGSAAEWDPGDYPDPPMVIDGTARLAVDRRARSSDPGAYATDYVPGVGEGYAWPLVVESIDGGRRATLAVTGIDDVPEGYAAVLIDPAAGVRVDLDGRSPYRFHPAGTGAASALGRLVRRELQILVGTPVWLEGMTAGLERLPARIELYPNYPNPFNPSTTLRFALREAGTVRLEIRNVRGQLVQVVADRVFDAGTHTLSWNGTDAAGRAVASGIYLAWLKVDGEVRTRKMTLVR